MSPVYGTRDGYMPAKRFWGLYAQLPRILALERAVALRTALRAQQLATADEPTAERELDELVQQSLPPRRAPRELPPLIFGPPRAR